MLAQALSIRIAYINIQAILIDSACANALCKVCWVVLKLVVLNTLTCGHTLMCLKQPILKQLNTLSTAYKTYTKRFDKTVLLSKTKHNIALNNKFTTTSGYIQTINWKRIHQIVVDITQAFKNITPSELEKHDSTLNFIVDKSASMLGKQRKVVTLISAVIKTTNLKYKICCYTTRHWHNSNSFKLWARAPTPTPGRVNDLLYLRCEHNLRVLTHLNTLNKENIDGEAIAKLTSTKHINVIINDNEPADYNTCLLNNRNMLTNHWKFMILSTNRKLIVLNLGQSKLEAKNCINLGLRLNKHKLMKIINTILKLNAL
ncbi:MAG: hypothetical protein AAJB65_00480 [Candidatus Hodgkinia cicadicola]